MTLRISIIIIVCILFSACQQIEIGEVQKTSIKEIKSNSIKLDILIEIKNTSIVPISLKGGDLKVYSFDNELGSIEMLNIVKIPANSTKSYTLNFLLHLKGDIFYYASLLRGTGLSSKDLSIKGIINIESLLIKREVRINQKLTF